MSIDKVILPNNLQDIEPIDGLRDNEEMIITLAKKINEIIDEVNK
jgi:hypothetical protein